MKRLIYNKQINNDTIFCMSNIRGDNVVVPNKLPFSFYFSSKYGNTHDIRVKPVFNPTRIIKNNLGTLQLHGNWDYTPSKSDRRVSESDISNMKAFFRMYFVIFSEVWDLHLSEDIVQDYFRGLADLSDVIQDLDFYGYYSDELDKITTIQELEDCLIRNNLVNMHGN